MDEYYMYLALEEAKKAAMLDEVPVGAVVVREGTVIARGHNLRELMKDSTAHAEMLAIHEACRTLGGWRLMDCDVYVTLEPCPMCAGALVNSRIRRLIYGASDPKAGAGGSVYNILCDTRLNHRIEVVPGVLEEKCSSVIKEYFKAKRK
jgi:tRNA(adenine34) deaminase